ncbi:hypothetical protein D918_03241 [Trichuris suis]|nr:hypothetical protein D918_03241 [Trichuris suis]
MLIKSEMTTICLRHTCIFSSTLMCHFQS